MHHPGQGSLPSPRLPLSPRSQKVRRTNRRRTGHARLHAPPRLFCRRLRLESGHSHIGAHTALSRDQYVYEPWMVESIWYDAVYRDHPARTTTPGCAKGSAGTWEHWKSCDIGSEPLTVRRARRIPLPRSRSSSRRLVDYAPPPTRRPNNSLSPVKSRAFSPPAPLRRRLLLH